MPKVYVCQVPTKKDKATDSFVPTINIGPAEKHGEVVIMMPSHCSFYATADLVVQLKNKLAAYSYEDGDSLLATGDPSIIATAAAILGKQHGKFNLLKWDKFEHMYVQSRIEL